MRLAELCGLAIALLVAPACDPAAGEAATPASAQPSTSAAPSSFAPSPAALTSGATAAASGTSAALVTATATASGSASSAPETPADMVRIPAGMFLMGAFEAVGNPDEHPAHEAILAGMYLDKTEVTLGAYRKCVQAGGCQPAHTDHRFCDYEAKGKDDHPINCVDLRQAAAFCKWAGKRLPTEREWEYAASNGRERRRFSWGLAEPKSGKNTCYDHPGGSCPVGSFAPGAFGLLDMTGNVWEWTASEFKRYPSAPLGDPIVDGKLYVYKGGSWSRRFSKWMRNLLRNRYAADKYSASIGMRCARTILPLECPEQTAAQDGVCVRNDGEPQCEPRYSWDGKRCRLGGAVDKTVAVSPSPRASGSSTAPLAVAPAASSAAPAGPIQVVRSRTPQHDPDCQRHWPKTPASYLFKGGPNYPSRKPIVKSAGCVPRDMSWGWTSACCRE